LLYESLSLLLVVCISIWPLGLICEALLFFFTQNFKKYLPCASESEMLFGNFCWRHIKLTLWELKTHDFLCVKHNAKKIKILTLCVMSLAASASYSRPALFVLIWIRWL